MLKLFISSTKVCASKIDLFFQCNVIILEMELANRADQRLLRWFGHVERMDEYRMARRVLMAEVSGGRVQGRPRLGWMDGVKVTLGKRGMTVEAARQCPKDRKSGEPWYIQYVTE